MQVQRIWKAPRGVDALDFSDVRAAQIQKPDELLFGISSAISKASLDCRFELVAFPYPQPSLAPTEAPRRGLASSVTLCASLAWHKIKVSLYTYGVHTKDTRKPLAMIVTPKKALKHYKFPCALCVHVLREGF